jgi:hypothetical protein
MRSYRGIAKVRTSRPGAAILLLATALALCFGSSAMAASVGQISGTVTSASGAVPIEGIEVCAFSVDTEAGECEETDAQGEYIISGLPSGEYDVEFSASTQSKLNFIPQYYDAATSFASAQPVPVTAELTTSGIDAKLQEGGQITGKVTSAPPGNTPIEGIEVCAFPAHEGLEGFGCATTSASGEYDISGLATGEYDIEFSSPLGFFSGKELDYVRQYYEGATSPAAAKAVPVTAGSTTPLINAALAEGGYVSGRVTDASTGQALGGILVCVSQESGQASIGNCAITDSNGEYKISGLANGSYLVEFIGSHGYLTQYFNGKSSPSEAQLVSVTAPQTTGGIGAALQISSTLPVNTTLPTVTGTPAVGSALLCANGLWTGKPAPTFSEQWLRDGTPVPGAASGTYTVQSADAGHTLSCQVTAKNTRGEKSATSAGLSIPANPPPPPPSSSDPTVTITGSKIVISGKSTKVHLQCSDATCQGSIELTVQVVVKHRKGKKTTSRKQLLVLAKSPFSLAKGKSATITLPLTATGRKRLGHVKHHPLAAKLILTVRGAKTITKSVLIS